MTVDVTLTITPSLRVRNCGSTAWVMAIVPSVLVSKTSRVVAIAVPSSEPSMPMPALLTSTSIGPAAAMAWAMLAASVTSSASRRKFGEAGSTLASTVRMVAITFQSRSRK